MSHRSRAQSPQGTIYLFVQDGDISWSGCAFLPACNRFLPFRHLFALASSTLTNAARHFQILGNSWEGPGPSCSLVQKDARGDKLTKTFVKSGHAPSRCLPGLKG